MTTTRRLRKHLFAAALAIASWGAQEAAAYSNMPGMLIQRTNRNGGSGCTGCHVATSAQVPQLLVQITGPATLLANGAATYTVTVRNNLGAGGTSTLANGLHLGAAIAASDAGTPIVKVSAPLTAQGVGELIHDANTSALATTASNTASYQFTYTMPAAAAVGSAHTLYAVSRVGLGSLDGAWSHAPDFSVLTAPPTPGGLATTTVTATSIGLSWNSTGGPAYRIVYKAGASAPANETDGTATDLGNVTSTTIAGLTANTQYTFRLFARSASNNVFAAGNSVTRFTAPQITSSLATINGTVNVAIASYTIVAAGATSFNALSLPAGVTIAGAVISGTPQVGGTFDVTLTATNSGGTTSAIKQYVIAKADQSVSFGVAPTPSYSPGGTFSVSATATSGGPVTYSSDTPATCSVTFSGTGTVSIEAAGPCVIRASQAGTNAYNPATNTQNITINAVAPAAPTIGVASSGNTTLSISFSPPSNNGGATITGYVATCSPSGSGSSTTSPILVSSLTNGQLYSCSVAAVNAVGPGASSASVAGTPRADPDGQLDPTFGTAGIGAFALGSPGDVVLGMTVQPDNKIVVVGVSGTPPNQDWAIVRYLANGALDNGFGTNGVVKTDIAGRNDIAFGVAIQPDGRIVVVGFTNNGTDNDIALGRYLPDGGLDSTFGTNGLVVTPNTGEDAAYGIAFDSKDRLVVSGRFTVKGLASFSVLRYDTAGKPDELFGKAGVATVNVGSGGGTATRVVIDSEKNIVAAGVGNNGTNNDVVVARFLPDGTPDPAFGGTGVVVTDFGGDEDLFGLTLAKDRPIVAGGRFFAGALDFLVARFKGDGTPDGSVIADVSGNRSDDGRGVVVQANGKIVVAGLTTSVATSVDFALMRFESTFAVDPTFGSAGSTVTAVSAGTGADSPGVGTLAPQLAGTVILAGTATNRFVVARYLLDAPAAFNFASFLAAGTSVLAQSNTITITNISIPVYVQVTNGEWSLNCDPAGFTTATGSISNGQTVCVRHTTAAGVGGSVTTTLVVGGQTGTFTTTTTYDAVPNAFGFTDQLNVTPGAVIVSNAVTISGVGGATPISVSGGSYSIGCTATFTALAGTINNGQTVCVRHTAPMALSAATNTMLTIGGVSDTFTSTTSASLPPTGDIDADGIPNGVELVEARNPLVKDNDVFANPRLFTMQQYRDFLAREGDAGGIQFYVDLLNAGTLVRANVIENFFNSPEFQGVGSPVARLYFATFLRIPDYPGLIFQIDAFRAGAPLAVIANNFTLSPEFTTRYGALNNTQYIVLLYQNILGRTPVQAEIDFYVNRLNSGFTRGDVLVGFSESPEYQANTAHDVYVTMMYVGMLRRAPEQAGFDFWVAYMDGGNSGLALILGFLQSQEYHNRFLP